MDCMQLKIFYRLISRLIGAKYRHAARYFTPLYPVLRGKKKLMIDCTSPPLKGRLFITILDTLITPEPAKFMPMPDDTHQRSIFILCPFVSPILIATKLG